MKAKQNNFMEGLGQCVSELLAVQKINQTADRLPP